MSPSLTWLYSVQQFGIKPGLDNTRRLLRELGLPGTRQRFLHVAGTNGKGSVCAFMESVLRASGERTGLFTSPHLVSFGERMRCGGRMIGPDEVDRSIEALRSIVTGWEPHPTFFELTLMLALDWLDREGAETIVLETGMGGRLDATNALTPLVSVITPVGMDHEQWLGDTIEKIAAEKAGIFKPGVPVVSAPQTPEAEAVIRQAAERTGSSLTVIGEPWPGPLPLPGEHQHWNAALAVAGIRAAGFRLTDSSVAAGLAATEWPARFQVLENGRLIIEGAHNPHGMATAAATWREKFGNNKATVIFGAVAAKDHAASLALLGGVAARFFFVTLQSPRAVPAEILAAAAPAGAEVRVFATLREALGAADLLAERRLVCGSLYLCGEALALRGNRLFEASAQ